jgi:DNA polymerase elongation subunit (family B)
VLDSNNVKEEGKHNPDIIKGSYTRQLSPVDVVEFDFNEDKQNPTRSFMSYEWKGIFLEDFRELYQKYTFTTLPSYSLESVASFELGEGKISHDSFVSFGALYLGSPEDYRYSSKNKEEWCLLDTLKEKISNGEDVLEEFKKESYNLFVTYGIKDIELLIELEEKLKLYPLAQLIAYTTGCNTDDVKGTLKQWQSFVFNEGFKRELILPLKSPFKQGTDTQFVGGWTHASRKFSKWVSSLDYTSLYPSIMMWSNMGSDTLVEYKDLPKEVKDIKEKYFIHYSKDIPKEEFPSIEANFINDVLRNPEVREEIHSVLSKYNLSATPNGSFFKKEVRSVLSELIEQMMVDRKIAKKEMKKAETRIEELKKLLYNLESSEK